MGYFSYTVFKHCPNFPLFLASHILQKARCQPENKSLADNLDLQCICFILAPKCLDKKHFAIMSLFPSRLNTFRIFIQKCSMVIKNGKDREVK